MLLKPPFLTEGKAIEEASDTLQEARRIGFDSVSLEPASLHEYTLMHALNLAGCYQVPWLWSVLKVAQTASELSDFRIGGVGFFPRPMNVAHNRHADGSDDCNERIWVAIKEYGRTRSLDVFSDIDCACRRDSECDCKINEGPLHERIDQQLERP